MNPEICPLCLKYCWKCEGGMCSNAESIAISRAAEIERLRAAGVLLVAALDKIANLPYGWDGDCGAVSIAEEAIAIYEEHNKAK